MSGVGAVIALKALAEAKSRMDAPPPLRRRLALAMFLDTVEALSAVIEPTMVVSGQPGLQALLHRLEIDAVVLADDQPRGLNAALQLGEDGLLAAGVDRVLACVGDLPTLTPAAVRTVLAAADRQQADDPATRFFVPDASGVGTTMLIATRSSLGPRFQGSSAAAHLDSGARALVPATPALIEPADGAESVGGPDIASRHGSDGQEWLRARRDVDNEEDLRSAYRLGVGPWTRALIDPATGSLGTFQSITVASAIDGTRYQAITGTGHRLPLELGSVQDRPVTLRSGQRLQAVTGFGRILAAWW